MAAGPRALAVYEDPDRLHFAAASPRGRRSSVGVGLAGLAASVCAAVFVWAGVRGDGAVLGVPSYVPVGAALAIALGLFVAVLEPPVVIERDEQEISQGGRRIARFRDLERVEFVRLDDGVSVRYQVELVLHSGRRRVVAGEHTPLTSPDEPRDLARRVARFTSVPLTERDG